MMITRMHSICAATILALTATGCATTPPPPGPPQPVAEVDRLRPGDTVTITVFGQEDLTGDQVIDSHGEVSVLLAGRTKIAGMSPAEAESTLTHQLSHGVIVNPSVSIVVSKHLPIYVVGEVTKPGGYDWANDLRVINAVALAGGYTYRAEKDALRVIRFDDPAKTETPVDQGAQIAPGDTIVVPERWF
jgi:protein involved in polysaccharide export with SLBB domain